MGPMEMPAEHLTIPARRPHRRVPGRRGGGDRRARPRLRGARRRGARRTGSGRERAELERELARWPVSPTETLFVAREAGKVIGFCGVECYPRRRDRTRPRPGRRVRSARPRRQHGRSSRSRCATASRTAPPSCGPSTGRDNRRGQALLAEAGLRPRRGHARSSGSTAGAHAARGARSTCGARRSDELPEVLALAESLGDDLHMTPRRARVSALVDPTWHVWISGIPNAARDRLHRSGRTAGCARSRRTRTHAVAASAPRSLSAALSGWWAEQPDATLGLSVRADSLAVADAVPPPRLRAAARGHASSRLRQIPSIS